VGERRHLGRIPSLTGRDTMAVGGGAAALPGRRHPSAAWR
jgi:hypothetical protein